jgi:hypothetical protein
MEIVIHKSGIEYIRKLESQFRANAFEIDKQQILFKVLKMMSVLNKRIYFKTENIDKKVEKHELLEQIGLNNSEIKDYFNNQNPGSLGYILCSTLIQSTSSTRIVKTKIERTDFELAELEFEKIHLSGNDLLQFVGVLSVKDLQHRNGMGGTFIKSNENVAEKLLPSSAAILVLPEFLSDKSLVDEVFDFLTKYFNNINLPSNYKNQLSLFYVDDYAAFNKITNREYAKSKFNQVKNLEYELVQLSKKYQDGEKYLDRQFFTLYNRSDLEHFFTGSKNSGVSKWEEKDLFSTEQNKDQIKKNIQVYNALLIKYLKRIKINSKETYYTNKPGFKNRIFKHLEPKQPTQQKTP